MRYRTNWRVEPDDEFIHGPFVYDDVEQHRRLLDSLNRALGWEKFRVIETDEDGEEAA